MAEEAHDHDHDHGQLHFEGSEVDDATLARIKEINPPLAESLEGTRRWSELSEDDRKAQLEKQRAVEAYLGWTPGYHADGDRCAVCGGATTPLFVDRFQEGRLAYGAFIANLPVHATRECIDAFPQRRKDLSPRGVDRARRELTRDMSRPSAGMSQFFRHDVLMHPPFGLEDWANSVFAANPNGLDKTTVKDIERLMQWVHHRFFHH